MRFGDKKHDRVSHREDLALLNVKARDVHEAGAVPWNFDLADFVHCGVSLATSQVGNNSHCL